VRLEGGVGGGIARVGHLSWWNCFVNGDGDGGGEEGFWSLLEGSIASFRS